jgi:hypothetical protein
MPPQQPLQPQQQPLGQEPTPQNPYGFIMEPPQQSRRIQNLKSPGSLLFIIGAAAIVIIVLVVIVAALRGGGGSSAPFIKLAQQQQEIIRIAGLDYSQLSQQNAKNFAITTQLSLSSDQTTLNDMLSRNHIKISPKQVALGANSQTDTQLDNAIATSTLDTTLTRVLHDELQAYKQSLDQAAVQTSGTALDTLNQLSKNADLLLQQSKQ